MGMPIRRIAKFKEAITGGDDGAIKALNDAELSSILKKLNPERKTQLYEFGSIEFKKGLYLIQENGYFYLSPKR